MGFLDITTPEKTPAEIAAKTIRILAKNSRELIEQLVNIYNSNIDVSWSNPNYTPETFVEALGTNALDVFQRSGALKMFILSQDSTAVERLREFPSEYNWEGGVIFQSDGSATLVKQVITDDAQKSVDI